MQFITDLSQAVVERMLEVVQIFLFAGGLGIFVLIALLMCQSQAINLIYHTRTKARSVYAERFLLVFSACVTVIGLVLYRELPESLHPVKLYPVNQAIALFVGANLQLFEVGARRFSRWQHIANQLTTSVGLMFSLSFVFMFAMIELALYVQQPLLGEQVVLLLGLSLYGSFALAYGISLSKMLRKVAE